MGREDPSRRGPGRRTPSDAAGPAAQRTERALVLCCLKSLAPRPARLRQAAWRVASRCVCRCVSPAGWAHGFRDFSGWRATLQLLVMTPLLVLTHRWQLLPNKNSARGRAFTNRTMAQAPFPSGFHYITGDAADVTWLPTQLHKVRAEQRRDSQRVRT